jgi:acyl carrier protein
MSFQDAFLEKMEYDDFMTAIKPKYNGTVNLNDYFGGPSLDSFVMLSSVSSVLGNRGQGNYAAGCAYQDALASTSSNFGTHYMSLNLGLIEGSDVDVLFPERREYMRSHGVIPVKMAELFALLEYSLSPESREHGCKQNMNGFDRASLSGQMQDISWKTPMLSHLPHVSESKELRAGGASSSNIEETLSATTTLDSAKTIICEAIVVKISTLVALDAEDISLELPLADFGLDSLVAIELKNWIVRKLLAPMQTSEILDMPSIQGLAAKIAERSALVSKTLHGGPSETIPIQELNPIEIKDTAGNHGLQCCHTSKELRKLPLLPLDKIFEYYLQGLQHLVTEEEYADAVKTTEEFQQPGSLGRELYDHVFKMANDPQVENWMADLYLHSMYLSRHWPTAPFTNMMGCLPSFPVIHSQADRAAIVALAAFKFKQDLEADEITPDHFRDTPLCMDAQHWLFNVARIPGVVSDEVIKFTGPQYDYLIVMRRGHIFKVPLTENGINVSQEKLRATFQSILDMRLEESWVGLLTADERDSWARVCYCSQ